MGYFAERHADPSALALGASALASGLKRAVKFSKSIRARL
jgi:hypothetical protein